MFSKKWNAMLCKCTASKNRASAISCDDHLNKTFLDLRLPALQRDLAVIQTKSNLIRMSTAKVENQLGKIYPQHHGPVTFSLPTNVSFQMQRKNMKMCPFPIAYISFSRMSESINET